MTKQIFANDLLTTVLNFTLRQARMKKAQQRYSFFNFDAETLVRNLEPPVGFEPTTC